MWPETGPPFWPGPRAILPGADARARGRGSILRAIRGLLARSRGGRSRWPCRGAGKTSASTMPDRATRWRASS